MSKIEIYSDGSFMGCDERQGYVHGGAITYLDGEVIHKAHYMCYNTGYASSRNVGGELLAAYEEFKWVCKNYPDVDSIDIIYDYEGVGKWLTGEWKCKKTITQGYRRNMLQLAHSLTDNVELNLIWVKGHEGTNGNEIADSLATLRCKEYCDEDTEWKVCNSNF